MISIVIPTYKHLEDCLRPCIESIKKYTDLTDVEVIVVANGPDDGTVAYVESQRGPFMCLKFPEPIGYTRACNEGMKKAIGDYIVLLNNDTVLLEQPLNQWLKMLKDPFIYKEVGITGPMKAVSEHIKKEFMIFFCVMISKKVLDEVGLLDEIFSPGFGEDVDWCMRMAKKGYTMMQVPNDKGTYPAPNFLVGGFPIWHAGNQTFSLTKDGHRVYREGFDRNIELLKKMYPIEPEIDGYMPEPELNTLKIWAKDHKKILEIGSWHGKSTRALAENTPGVVYAVDTWYGSDDEPQNHGSAYLLNGDHAIMEFTKNNADLMAKGKIIPIRMHSKNACDTFKALKMKFDMIFIDGDHSYEGCKSDIVNTKDLLEDGGLWCGHDYTAWVGVKQAVDELIPEIETRYTMWSTVKKRKEKMKIVDCVLFFNELELLEIRLNELDEVVDKFIIIESTYTHAGKTKPLYFDKQRFAKFMPKINYVVLDTLPAGANYNDVWAREQYSRDKFKELVDNDTDVVILTDIDEIPNVEVVKNYRPEMGFRYLDMKLYYYWLNCYSGQWDQAKIVGYKDFINMTPVQIRYTKCRGIENGGWHFSFQGGVDRILEKIQAWAHSEYNRPDIANKEWITEAINTPKDVLKRPDVSMKFVPMDKTYPKYIKANLGKYKDWINCSCVDCPKCAAENKLVATNPTASVSEKVSATYPTANGKKLTVSAVICTRNRYDSTLPLCISAIVNQTLKPKELIIYDDSDEKRDLRKMPLYENLLAMCLRQEIVWKVLFGDSGQVDAHRRSIADSTGDFIWRVDDDCIPEPNVLQGLMDMMTDSTGAVGGLVIDPKFMATSSVASSKMEDIYLGLNEQWFKGKTKAFPVDHLYSTFLYRKSAAKPEFYHYGLSRIGHREETIFTYKLKRSGWGLSCNPGVITWHLRHPSGGIRLGQPEMWAKDERIFMDLLREWGVTPKAWKVIVLDNGIGDHYVFKKILPDVRARYPYLILSVCYPDVFKGCDIPLISIAEAKTMGINEGVYKFMSERRWTMSLERAYRALYL